MSATRTQPKILVVDDEKQWRNSLREVLENEEKYAVDTAEDYGDATAKLAKADAEGRPFSLVTVDLAFEGPGVCDGEMLLRHIARIYKGTPCIVVSGSESSPERASELTSKYGARFFQKKSFASGKAVKFLEVVETVLDEAFQKLAHKVEESREKIGVPSRAAATIDSDEIASLQTQLRIHRKNLNRLEKKKALHGELAAPLDLLNEIDIEKEEIARLEAELCEFKKEPDHANSD